MTVIEAARTTMTSYLEALIARGDFAQYLTSDVTFQMMWTDQEAHSREAVEGMIRYFHSEAFDARPELKCLLVDGERAAVEIDFVARHIAEFAGRPATGKHVRMPYTVIYDLEGDRIKALRIYMSMDELLRQIDA
jgi:predicted ester cyclase